MLLTALGLATAWALPALALAPQQQPRFEAQQQVLLGDGAGQFTPLTPIALQGAGSPEIDDPDGDGIGDVTLWTESSCLACLSFGPPMLALKPEFVVSRRYHGIGVDTPIGVGHATPDGRLDVITTFGLRPAVYINQGP